MEPRKNRRLGGIEMKREDLKAMGLTDEQIDKVMAENGKDVEKAKGDLATKETELENAKEQLKTANETIESYKSMDIDSIKQSAEEYKTKFEEAQKQAKADMEKLQFDHALENALTGSKAKNVKAVQALLDLEGLKFNDGDIVGLKDQLEKIKEENDYLFEIDEPSDPTPSITTQINKNPDKGQGTDLGSALKDFYKN